MSNELFLSDLNTLIIDSSKNPDRVNPISQINEYLFLGQGRTTLYGGMLWKLGITHILSIGRSPHGSVKNGPFEKLEILDAPDLEQTDLSKHFPTIFEFVKKVIEQNGKVYVHCEMGCSRAATVMIAIIRHAGYANSLQSAYNQVKLKRPWIAPNLGFLEQLRKFFSESLDCS